MQHAQNTFFTVFTRFFKTGTKFVNLAQPSKIQGLKDVDKIVAITSAKGGVGKSSTAVNVAVALATALKLRVGLLDADIHGPSIPIMMNLRGPPSEKDQIILPLENYRVKCMSFGFFMKEDQPAIWRGPMTTSAFTTMLFQTDWGHLDVLIVDMPPGTGDAQINLAQRIPLSGAVIVTTPGAVALGDVARGVKSLSTLNVPLLGMVGSMTRHVCRCCGAEEAVFGSENMATTAEQMGLELLEQIPLDLKIAERCNTGVPVVVADPSTPAATAYVNIAKRLVEKLQSQPSAATAGPKISVV